MTSHTSSYAQTADGSGVVDEPYASSGTTVRSLEGQFGR